jgi:hypothetical protein
MKGAIRVLLVGAAAGYLAGQVMDKATTRFYERQSDASKQREGELLPGGAPMASARKLAWSGPSRPTTRRPPSPPPCTSRWASSTGWSRPR